MIEKDREPAKSILTVVYKGGTTLRCGVKLESSMLVDMILEAKTRSGNLVLPTTNASEEIQSDQVVIGTSEILFYNVEIPMPPKIKSGLVIAGADALPPSHRQ